MTLWCCGCGVDVEARLTTGAETYPHRPDLHDLPRWRCDKCGNHVGCHHKTKDRTRPLGVIPDSEMSKARQHIHAILDPLWKERQMRRRHIYASLTATLGRQYHTADLRTIDEARLVYRALQQLERDASVALC